MTAPDLQASPGSWATRYDRLLEVSGLDRKTILSGALQSSAGERRGLFSLQQCLEQPALLTDQVSRDYPHASNARAIRARVSVLQQDLALNIIGPLTLRLFRDGETPLPDPDRIFLAPVSCDDEPASRWFRIPTGRPVNESTFVRALGSRASGWYPIFRKGFGVSRGAYWSSIGLGLGMPFSAVWNLVEPTALCEQAQGWLEQFGNETNQFVDWIPAVFGEQRAAIPQRKGCCLKYSLPGGGYCGTCGVYRKERMAALTRQPARV